MTFHIKTFLSSLLQPKQQSWKIDLLNKWPEIMGNLASHVSIEKIQNDMILLGVKNSSWLQELYLMGPTILQTINQNLDQPRFKTIRFKQRGNKPRRVPIKKDHDAPVNVPDRKLTASEQHALDRITDPTLKTVLHSFLMRCSREKKK